MSKDHRRTRSSLVSTASLVSPFCVVLACCGPESGDPVTDSSRPAASDASGGPGTVPTGAEQLLGLRATEPRADFGRVIAGEIRTHRFPLQNAGNMTVRILKIQPDCGCTLARLETMGGDLILPERGNLRQALTLVSLAPGEECQVVIELNTAGQGTGPLSKGIEVQSDDPLHSKINLHLHAEIRMPFTIEPAAVPFGIVQKGQTPRRTVTVRPADIGAVEIEEFSVLPAFLEASHRALEGDDGQRYFELELSLSRDAPVGEHRSKVVARVKNQFVQEFAFWVLASIQPRIRFDTGDLDNREWIDFELLRVGQPVTRSVEIFNEDESVPYSITGIEVDSKQEDLLRAKLITLEEGQHYRVELVARATRDMSPLRGKLKIRSIHPDLPIKEIRFQGRLDRRK